MRRLLAWGRANRRAFPWRETDDAFRILIAELLLQRSRAKTVAPVHEELFDRWPTAGELARARVASIAAVIRPLGLTGRAKHIKAIATACAERGVPAGVDALQELPGVGRYVANATVAVAFGKPAPVVDGVTARVYRRYFGLPDDAPAVSDERLWQLVAEVTPKRGTDEWNWAVLDLASAICKPKRPTCDACPLEAGCTYALDVVTA